jgi:pimeloyl-ACP methyl ester carboxylesterase
MAWSVFSSQSVSASELEGLMRQFDAQPTVLPMGDQPEPGSWSVPIIGGQLVVSDATSDLRAMPPAMIHAAIRLLGTTPVYCLSIFAVVGHSTGAVVPVEDSDETAQLVQRIVNAFGERWRAVLSDNSAAPMIALGSLARQAPQEHRPVPKLGWRRFLGR